MLRVTTITKLIVKEIMFTLERLFVDTLGTSLLMMIQTTVFVVKSRNLGRSGMIRSASKTAITVLIGLIMFERKFLKKDP